MQTATYRTEHMTNTGVDAARRNARQYAKRRTGTVAMDTIIVTAASLCLPSLISLLLTLLKTLMSKFQLTSVRAIIIYTGSSGKKLGRYVSVPTNTNAYYVLPSLGSDAALNNLSRRFLTTECKINFPPSSKKPLDVQTYDCKIT